MPAGETRPLLQHQQSLTAEYQDYEHSDHAFRTGIKHVVIYYALTLIFFSFLVEKWPIVDSLYYASVLVSTSFVCHEDVVDKKIFWFQKSKENPPQSRLVTHSSPTHHPLITAILVLVSLQPLATVICTPRTTMVVSPP